MSCTPKPPIAVLGLPLDSLRVAEAVEAIEALILSGGAHQVAAANLHFWQDTIHDPHLHRIVAGCSLVIPGGMPLVWASGLMGCPLAERVTGVDLLPLLAAMSARKGYKLFLLGNQRSVLETAANRFQQDFPGVRIAGIFAPGEQDLTRIDHQEILDLIHAAQPHVLLVAFESARQEKWIWMHRKQLGVPVAMGVGEALETLTGSLPRGPRWLRQSGFEWLFRCLRDPMQMLPFYARSLGALARRLPLALAVAWFQHPCFRSSSVTSFNSHEAHHIHLHGRLTLGLQAELDREIQQAIAGGRVAVVHLGQLCHISADGMGVLLSARRRMLDAGLTLSLAGLNWKLRLLLHAWCLRPLFDEWRPSAIPSRTLSLSDLPLTVAASPALIPAKRRTSK